MTSADNSEDTLPGRGELWISSHLNGNTLSEVTLINAEEAKQDLSQVYFLSPTKSLDMTPAL